MEALNLLMSAGLVFAVDQLAKRQVTHRIGPGQFVRFSALVSIRRVFNKRNTGGFGRNGFTLIALWCLMICSTVLLISSAPILKNQGAQLGLGAALGGASSNVRDWLWRGAVLDYIDIGFWPVFNLADLAIVLGVAAALFLIR